MTRSAFVVALVVAGAALGSPGRVWGDWLPPGLEKWRPGIEGTAQERERLTAELPPKLAPFEFALAYQWLRCDATGGACRAIPGASAKQYLVTAADVGRTVRVEVSARTGRANAGFGRPLLISAPTEVVRHGPPLNEVAPAVSGVTRDGETLVAFSGAWVGAVDSTTVTWLRCDPTGHPCESVGSGAKYPLTEADVDSVFAIEVTASGPGGAATVRSGFSALVQPSPLVATAAPSISGALVVGQTLTATVGVIEGTGPVSREYQWLRCGADGTCSELSGATGPRYRLTSADVGARLQFRVVARNAAGGVVLESEPTSAIEETAESGYANVVLADGPAAYWRLGESSGKVVTDASGRGNDGTYVTGFSLGHPGALSGDTAAVFNGTSGRAELGDRFDFTGRSPFTIEAWIQPAIIDHWHRRILNKEGKNAVNRYEGYRFAMNGSLGLYCERWQNGGNQLVSAPPASFATGQWYHVACVYDGTMLRLFVNGVQVIAKKSIQEVAKISVPLTIGSYPNGGSSSFWAGGLDELAVYERDLTAAELSAHVQAAAPRLLSAGGTPRIHGELGVGQHLSATSGTWAGTGPLRFEYQWRRCDASGAGCTDIAGATADTHRVSPLDVGATLRVQVRSTGEGGSRTAESHATAVIPVAAPFELCVEAEHASRSGSTSLSGGSANTVVLGAGGEVTARFELDQARSLSAWARVRTPKEGANRFSTSLRTGADEEWTAPVSPVLRWQRLSPGSQAGLAPALNWPGRLSAGGHALTLRASEPNVEVDAICLSSDDRGPAERFVEAPERAITHLATAFGARGDGVSDDTAALQAALSALRPGDALRLPAGRYRFTGPLTLKTSEVSIIGDGPGTVLFADFPRGATGRAINVVGGYESHAMPLLAPAIELDRELRIGASSAYRVGDLVRVSSDPYGPPAPFYPGQFFRNRNNHARITAIRIEGSEQVLVLDRPLLSGFDPVNGARVERFNGATGVVFANLKIEGTSRPTPADNADIDLLWVSRCGGCFFSDLELAHARKSGLEVARSVDGQVIRVHAHDSSDTGGGGHGYGVAVGYSQGTVVRHGLFDGKLRHGVTVSWGSRETFVFDNTFDRSVEHAENFASVDVHGQDDYANLVEGNRVHGGKEGLIVGGGGTSHGNDGPWNVVRGNVVTGSQYGISVHKQTHDAIIEDNRIADTTVNAIRIETGSARTRIRGNRIVDSGGVGVSVKDSDATAIVDNDIQPSTGPAVRVTNGSGWVIDDVVVHGSAVEASGAGTTGSIW